MMVDDVDRALHGNSGAKNGNIVHDCNLFVSSFRDVVSSVGYWRVSGRGERATLPHHGSDAFFRDGGNNCRRLIHLTSAVVATISTKRGVEAQSHSKLGINSRVLNTFHIPLRTIQDGIKVEQPLAGLKLLLHLRTPLNTSVRTLSVLRAWFRSVPTGHAHMENYVVMGQMNPNRRQPLLPPMQGKLDQQQVVKDLSNAVGIAPKDKEAAVALSVMSQSPSKALLESMRPLMNAIIKPEYLKYQNRWLAGDGVRPLGLCGELAKQLCLQ
ncbi:hypothetical protein M8C21_021817 [Ambrosia artemisiifolia]|uniref:Uncharacterized protein n=1 Tax=Ambrosia artemisiifolia TaxID=4212 RepID=A0AAD5GP94_AMBAR|nr:hypothetical protein M8C21_021817 [Ambrosia artemisiifolia]